ncbi:hypothetical protein [Acetatifactor aquisgranensis]|uniref:hypothetical protein n=1 Tax=Acetatifactor aquisgranensis TaxID=2941233 RepID=UPI00203F2CD9|nr:hypothetical protein [Acetatifactor aquisgranensis]
MNPENNPADNMPKLPMEIYGHVLMQSAEIDEYQKQELTLSYVDLDGSHELKTCYGDVLKTINALMDYTRMLDIVCDQWELTGFHRATYEYHAGKLREIADKFQKAISYDYAAAVEKCRKKKARKQAYSDVGEDALALAVRSQQKAAEKQLEDQKTEEPVSSIETSPPYPAENTLPAWEDDF